MAEAAKRKPSAPKGLGKEASRFWREVVGTYDLRADELRILAEACREIDLIELLEEEQEGSPVMVSGSMGQLVISPMISELRQHRGTLKALLGALKLPDEPGGEGAGAASKAGAELAARRWQNPGTAGRRSGAA